MDKNMSAEPGVVFGDRFKKKNKEFIFLPAPFISITEFHVDLLKTPQTGFS